MQIVVITGGLGSGKSTAAEFFRAAGARVLDLDEVSVAVTGPESSINSRLAEEFGASVLRADGSLDRASLAELAFSDREATLKLNAIMHPAIAEEAARIIEEAKAGSAAPVLVIEVPLLVEAPSYRELADSVIAVSAPVEVRVARAVARGLSEDEARRRIAAQATDAQREELADVVIDNGGDVAPFLRRLGELWDGYVAAAGSAE